MNNESRYSFELKGPPPYLVWSREFWFLDLEVKESRNCDCIEKPGSETEKKEQILLSLHLGKKP